MRLKVLYLSGTVPLADRISNSEVDEVDPTIYQ
jgi:hypothetical protein